MTTNNSLDYFIRQIQEKHSALVNSSNVLIQTLAGEQLPGKYVASEHTNKLAISLSDSLASADRPGWLVTTIIYTQRFNEKTWTAGELLVNFLKYKTELDTHQWQFDQPVDQAFNFDAIFERFRKESQLPRLFDEIVVMLDAIKASDTVDSRKMHDALSRIVATVKKGKTGSYPAFTGAWQFLISFLENFLWAELSKIPVLGTITDSLRKAINETSEEMNKLNADMRTEIVHTANEAGITLNSDSVLPFIGYSQNGKLTLK